MARQALNFGTSAPNDGGTLKAEFEKIEANFIELYDLVASPDPELVALAGLTSAADALPYFTGPGAAATTTLTAFGRSLIDDANATAAQTTLALVPGTNVQAYSARLADVAGLSPADGNIIVGDGSTWVAENGATARASLGLGSAATAATSDFLSSADNTVTYAKLQDVSATQRVLGRNTAGSGDPEEVTATQVLDWLGTTRGSILFRGASGWSILSPGTVGQVVQSNGAGADPSYASVAGTGDVIGPASSVDNEITLFSGTGGKNIKRASTSGILFGTSGVLSALTVGSGLDLTGSTLTSTPAVVQIVAAGTSVGTGTALNLTDLPQVYRTIVILLTGVSSGGTAQLLMQLSGDTGGSPTFVTSGYGGCGVNNTPAGTGFSAGILASFSTVAATTLTGVIALHNYANGNYPYASLAYSDSASVFAMAQGQYPTALDVNAVRLIWTGGASFDAGTYGVWGIK